MSENFEKLGSYVKGRTMMKQVACAMFIIGVVVSIMFMAIGLVGVSTFGHPGSIHVDNPAISSEWYVVIFMPVICFSSITYAIFAVYSEIRHSKRAKKIALVLFVMNISIYAVFEIAWDAVLLTLPPVDQWAERLMMGVTIIGQRDAFPSILWCSLFLASFIGFSVTIWLLMRKARMIEKEFDGAEVDSSIKGSCSIDIEDTCKILDGRKVCKTTSMIGGGCKELDMDTIAHHMKLVDE